MTSEKKKKKPRLTITPLAPTVQNFRNRGLNKFFKPAHIRGGDCPEPKQNTTIKQTKKHTKELIHRARTRSVVTGVDRNFDLCQKGPMIHPNPYFDIPYFPDDTSVVLSELAAAGEAPLELEIGFGRGHFLLDRARAVPNHHILGLETKRKGVFTAVERAKKHNFSNIHPFHGDALRGMPRMTPDASVTRVFIHFPDPWWKVRHEKRMVVCPELVEQAARLLVDGGELFVQTDVDYRADQYLNVLLGCTSLAPLGEKGVIEHNPFDARSLREKKCIETGLAIYRMLFRRKPR